MSFYTLGIETSCDETACAVLKDDREILSNVVFSQADLHTKFGGVVPEIASRNHLKKIIPVIQESLAEARLEISEINLVGATYGPGLVGPLLVGLSVAKSIAYGLAIPFVGVNHLEAHIFAHFLEYGFVSPPLLALIVSGGHTSLVQVRDYGDYEVLGSTCDDAAGEAFDKVGNLLGLGYPAGQAIDELAKKGDSSSIDLPRPMLKDGSLNFSFAGLKTAVVYYLKDKERINKFNVASSFQNAVVEVLVKKTLKAAFKKDLTKIAVVGGVAANSGLRDRFKQKQDTKGLEVFFPSLSLCTDNGAMIAACAHFNYKNLGSVSGLDLPPQPSLPIG